MFAANLSNTIIFVIVHVALFIIAKLTNQNAALLRSNQKSLIAPIVCITLRQTILIFVRCDPTISNIINFSYIFTGAIVFFKQIIACRHLVEK